MKILIMDGKNNLVWQDVVYKQGRFYNLDGTSYWSQTNIYSIKDDDRNKLTICSACGKEIPNKPSAINAHRNMVNKPDKCFDCTSLRPERASVTSQKYTLNDDGSYTESTKRNVHLVCNNGYRNYDINSDNARQACRYARCEKATFKSVEDFWTQYPNAFDEFITIDKIIEDEYKDLYRYNTQIVIAFKGRMNLEAHINNQGLCYEFLLVHRRCNYVLRYSKKYDKVWIVSYGFQELSKADISECTQAAIIKKMRSLYE